MVISVGAMVAVASASAGRAERISFSVTPSGVVEGTCAFPVTWNAMVTASDLMLYDGDGALVAEHMKGAETDVLSANGKTLTGDPYSFAMHVTYDASGGYASFYVSGETAKFRRNGTLWMSAGRADVIPRLELPWSWYPDVGRFDDASQLCAVLAP